MMAIKNIIMSETIVIILENTEVLLIELANLRYKTQKEIPVVLRNGSTYDYHFLIKELTEKSEGEFECLGENTKKYITFFSVNQKENYGNDKITNISYKIKFVNRFRFMSSSLSNLVDNLSEGLHRDECTDCKSFLDYMITKDDHLIFRCFEYKKNYEKDFN